MHYYALACDYDGTLATNGRVPLDTLDALNRLRASGRRLVLVTGGVLSDLQETFPEWTRFEYIVAENGAVLLDVKTRDMTLLAEPPPPALAEELRKRGVDPLGTGHVIVATWEPHETTVLQV